MLKKLLMIAAFIFSPVVFSAQANTQTPYLNTEIAAGNVFKAINEQSASIKQNPDILKNIVTTDLLPYIHVKYAAALALGSYYKEVSKQDRDAYFVAFEKYLIQSFAQAMSMYNGQTYQIDKEKDLTGKNIVAVKVLLMSPDKSQQPIRIDFQWRKNTATGEWQVYDMVAEGISMITTKQNEWASTLRQGGIKALIKQLEQQASTQIDPNATPEKTH